MGFREDWLLFTDQERRRRINTRVFRFFSIIFGFFGVVFLITMGLNLLTVVFLLVAAFFGLAWFPSMVNRNKD